MVNADVGVVAPTGLANAIAIQRAEFVDTLMHGWTYGSLPWKNYINSAQSRCWREKEVQLSS
jgi:hypothetical protein